MLKTYGIFGTHFFSKSNKIPIQIMAGIRRKRINKAIVIEGGGKYDIKKFSYYFHEKGVVDKYVFDNVVGGKGVHYVDRLGFKQIWGLFIDIEDSVKPMLPIFIKMHWL